MLSYIDAVNEGFLSFLEKRRPKVLESPVFHYTSAESLKGIIERGKFWLSNAAYLNDPAELSYPVTVVRAVIGSRPKSGRDVFRLDSRDGLPVDSLFTATQEQHELFRPWYTGSFSLKGDDLSQWRAYCPNGGYSIGFDGRAVCDKIRQDPENVFGSVEYSEAAQRQRLDEILDFYFSQRDSLWEQYSQHSEVEQMLVRNTGFLLSRESLLFKMKAFEAEEEWRIGRQALAAEPYIRDVRFRVRNSQLVPYIELELSYKDGKLPISEIRVAPIGDQDLAAHVARLVLQANGYDPGLVKASSYRLR
jgi:hypothetical protein